MSRQRAACLHRELQFTVNIDRLKFYIGKWKHKNIIWFQACIVMSYNIEIVYK